MNKKKKLTKLTKNVITEQPNYDASHFDVQGSWTGINFNNELSEPVQDADDL